MRARHRRFSIREPIPGTSENGRLIIGAGISSGCQIVTPSGLFILQAIFAKRRFEANPIEQVMYGPILFRIRLLMRLARPFGSAIAPLSSRQVTSSMDLIVNAGLKFHHAPEQKYTTRILRRVVPRPCSAACPQEADAAVPGLWASRIRSQSFIAI